MRYQLWDLHDCITKTVHQKDQEVKADTQEMTCAHLQLLSMAVVAAL